jgi:hypothetical protein
MTHFQYCLCLNQWYWRFEAAGFHNTAAAIAEMLRQERDL